jgi:hypothetical protein
VGCIITGAGVEIGTIVGVIVAAWQCGLFDLAIEGLVFLIDTVGEFLTDIFDPKPDNFSWYIDVAGPALRPTGWTPSSDYDRRFFSTALAGMPPAVKAEAEKAMTTRIAGSKLSGFTGVWLIRRTKELGGGAEEWARPQGLSEMLELPQGCHRLEGEAGGKARLCGDVRFEEVEPIASAISPVPGGVGPMTVTLLLVNTVASWCQRCGLDQPLADLLP